MLFAVPWPGVVEAPAIVEFDPHTVIRAQCAGFVDRIHVASGQHVAAGDLLLELRNPEVANEAEDLRLQLQQAEIRRQGHDSHREIAARQEVERRIDRLRTELAETTARVDALRVRAPRDGTVLDRDLAVLAGTYFAEGDELLSLGREEHKELRVSVGQQDVDAFERRVGQTVRVDLPERPIFPGRLQRVEPRASTVPLHPALTADNGGALPVRPSEATKGERELLSPRFDAVVSLSSGNDGPARAGQRGRVFFRTGEESIGSHLYRTALHWLRQRLEPSQLEWLAL